MKASDVIFGFAVIAIVLSVIIGFWIEVDQYQNNRHQEITVCQHQAKGDSKRCF